MTVENYWDPVSDRFEVATRRPIVSVKVLICNSLNQVLLLRRADHDPHRPGAYDLPGGGPRSGEQLERAAARETLEEIAFNADRPTSAEDISRLASVLTPLSSFQYTSRKDGLPKLKHMFGVKIAAAELDISVDPLEHAPTEEIWVGPNEAGIRLGQPECAARLRGLAGKVESLPQASYNFRS